jgi:hypothetical protein
LVEVYFVSLQSWEGFGQQMMRFILCPRWYDMSMVNTCCIRGVWSTYVEIYFVSLLACEVYRQHMLRGILCPRWDGRGFLNTSSGTYYFLAGMEYDWSNLLEMHLLSSRVWEVLLNTC